MWHTHTHTYNQYRYIYESIIWITAVPHLGQAEIDENGSDTKDDLENDKNNDDSF